MGARPGLQTCAGEDTSSPGTKHELVWDFRPEPCLGDGGAVSPHYRQPLRTPALCAQGSLLLWGKGVSGYLPAVAAAKPRRPHTVARWTAGLSCVFFAVSLRQTPFLCNLIKFI